MRILVPLNNMDLVDKYIEAGAEEFYIGFADSKWEETFGDFADINRMSGFKKNANQYNLDQVIDIIHQVKQKGKFIYITFNSSIYSDEQFEYIRGYMKRLKNTPVDGVIVSCIELVHLAVEEGLFAVVSTIAGVYNTDIAKFYYDHGAGRIILPRDLQMDEIEEIVTQVPEAEYEVFLMRNGCPFSDANCLGMHRNEMCSICSSLKNSDKGIVMEDQSFDEKHAVELNSIIYNYNFHNFACGLCSIYRFMKLNITAGKIVGRTDEWENICKDIAYVKENIEIAKSCSSEEEYLEKMKFSADSTAMCKMGMSCYYPEIRFGGKN